MVLVWIDSLMSIWPCVPHCSGVILAQVVDVDAEDTKRRSAEVELQFCCSQSPFYLDFADMPRCSLSLSKFVSGFEHQPADS